MSFPAGQRVEQVEVLESPPGKTRVQITGTDGTTIQFWCPNEILTKDLEVAEEYDAEYAAAERAAADLLASRPTSRDDVISIIREAYSGLLHDYDSRLHESTRLRRKWRSAWSAQKARSDKLEKRLNELACPDGDIGSTVKGRVSNLLRLVRELRTAELDGEHEKCVVSGV